MTNLYDYSNKPIKNPEFKLRIENVTTSEQSAYEATIPKNGDKTKISIPLTFVKDNSLLKVHVSVKGEKEYTNSWRIFVYKDAGAPELINRPVETIKTFEEAKKKGGRYIITPNFFNKESLSKNSFIPVFWSPVHFPSEAPVGFMINEKSPVLKLFPSEKYADYQWKDLVDDSYSVKLASVKGAEPILEFVPNFTDNEPKSALFTFKEGNAEFIYCGFDLSKDDLITKALKRSIYEYVNA